MAGGEIADSKYGDKRMEGGEDSVNVRTVDCLRGRLLAERQASRNAKEEADQLGNKLMKLENELREEARARKRAEKRLKLLLKKLECLNIADDESCVVDKSEISSVSSSSTSKEVRESHGNHQMGVSRSQEDYTKSPQKLEPDEGVVVLAPSEMWMSGTGNDPKPTSNLNKGSQDEGFEESGEVGCGQDSKMDEQSCHSGGSEEIDNSMALIAVEVEKGKVVVDAEVLDQTVREVLDALSYAKEQIQSSMEKRRSRDNNMVIRVG